MIETITQNIESWSSLIDAITSFIPKLITACTVLSAFLPTPDHQSILSKIHKSINLIAFNFGKAANKE